MADQNQILKIVLQLQADVAAGVSTTKAALQEIQAQAVETARVVNSVGQTTVAVNPANVEAIAQSEARMATMMATQEKGIVNEALINAQMERRVVIETQLEAAEARIAGNPALAARLEREAEIRTRALTIQRTLNITTEESIALAERLVLAQEAGAVATNTMGINMGKARAEALVLGREIAAGNVRASTMSSLLGSMGTAFTLSGLAAYEIYHLLDSAAEASLKLAQETRKQTDELVKQLTQWNELAKAAGNFGDVIKIGDKIQADLDKAATKLEEFRNKELGAFQLLGDLIARQWSAIPGTGPTPYASGLEKDTAAQLSALQSLIREGTAWRETAEAATRAWENLKLEPLNDAIGKQSALLEEAKAKYTALNAEAHKLAVGNLDEAQTAHALDVARQLEAAGKEVELQTARVKELTTAETNLDAQSRKVADAMKKIEFGQLDNAGQLNALETNIEEIHSKLLELGVAADSPNEAIEKSKNLTKDTREEVIQLAAAWGQVLSQIGTALGEQVKLKAQLDSFAQSQAVINATAYGTRDEAYKAEWGARYNKILQDREKIGADTSAAAINDQIAAEQAAADRKKQWAEEDREAGKVGSTQKQINELTREQANILAQIRADQQGIQKNPFLSDDQKQAAMLPLVRQEIAALGEQLKRDQAEQAKLTDPAEWSRMQGAIIQSKAKLTELGFEMQKLTFVGGLRAGLVAWVNQFGDAAKQVTNIITGTLNTAIQSTSAALTTAIFKTGDWKQAFAQAAQSIVQNIIQIGLQMIVTSTLGRLLSALNVTEQTAAGAKIATANAPAAAATSIASYGGAAVSGGAAAAAAIAAIISALTLGAAGGMYIDRGTHSTADDVPIRVSRGEGIINARAVAAHGGKAWVDSLNSGVTRPAYASGGFVGSSPSSAGSSPGAAPQVNLHLAVFDDPNKLAKWLAGRDGEKIIYDTVNRRRIDLGIS